MGIITSYPDDSATTDSDRFLTSDSSGATKLTPASNLKTYLGFTTNPGGGWSTLANTPNTVTYLGNRSYQCVFNGVNLTTALSPGMRLMTTRTVAAPTQSTSLNGTTQYWSKASPAGMTFTNNYSPGRWIKLANYPASFGTIESRFDGTSGWELRISSVGQVNLVSYNAGSGNYHLVSSYQSVPLNKWVFVAAQADMTVTTNTSTTNYITLDGVDVPATVSRGGTSPTALVQSGIYQLGASNSTNFFPGKLGSGWLFGAKVTQATWNTYFSQAPSGSESGLVSAYSFNGTANDLNTTNANNLTANGSAVATNADSPFGGQAGGTISSTLDYGIIQSVSFSTNTTVVTQVPEGCTIPTSGGVSAVAYSSVKVPYGFPASIGKWQISVLRIALNPSVASPATGTYYDCNTAFLMPVGSWAVGVRAVIYGDRPSSGFSDVYLEFGPTKNASGLAEFAGRNQLASATGGSWNTASTTYARNTLDAVNATTYYQSIWTDSASMGQIQLQASSIIAENAYL